MVLQGTHSSGSVTAEWFRHLASSSVLLFLAGLAITGYGMGVFFAGAAPTVFFHGGGSGVHFIALGLVVVVAGVQKCSVCESEEHHSVSMLIPDCERSIFFLVHDLWTMKVLSYAKNRKICGGVTSLLSV